MASTIDDLTTRTAAAKPLFAADQPHPYLSGIHAPLAREVTVTDLQVTGTIPAELDGRYLRIGPNPVTPPNPAAYHWFIGDGMVHGVRLEGGKAQWYRNRWVRSKAVSAALGEAAAPGPRNGMSDTANTNVLGHAGKTWALVEAGGFPVELSETLDTVAHNPFEGTLKASFSAHPHLDPLTGEMHAICYAGTDPTTIRHVVVGKDGKIIAFANLWLGNGREELSIDLMRHATDAPRGVMDYLFIELMLWGKAQGYQWFNLGMAPLSGLENHPLAPFWHKVGRIVHRYGEPFYNFNGLRRYKDKFQPEWRPRYLASPGGLVLPRILVDTAALIAGGIKEVIWKS